jgi:sulfoxide reductase heme-binding subunit YedZ
VAVLALDAFTGALGANPVQRATLQTGQLALTLLVGSLACTPLSRLTGWAWPARIRKALGLLAFTYAALHFLIYAVVDHALDLRLILEDVAQRPFITAGFAALVLLVPLALTSTKASVRRMGFAAWQRLHSLAYLAAILGAVHFYWQVKKDVSEPLRYAAVLAALFVARLLWPRRRARRARRATGEPGDTPAGPPLAR